MADLADFGKSAIYRKSQENDVTLTWRVQKIEMQKFGGFVKIAPVESENLKIGVKKIGEGS